MLEACARRARARARDEREGTIEEREASPFREFEGRQPRRPALGVNTDSLGKVESHRVEWREVGGGEGDVRDSTSSGNFCEMPFAAVDRRRRFILTYRREARRHLRVLIANYRRLTRRD